MLSPLIQNKHFIFVDDKAGYRAGLVSSFKAQHVFQACANGRTIFWSRIDFGTLKFKGDLPLRDNCTQKWLRSEAHELFESIRQRGRKDEYRKHSTFQELIRQQIAS